MRARTIKRGKNDLIRMYLNEIARIPLLSPDEEKALGALARQGDLIAMQKLMESNLRFVVSVCKKYVRRSDQLMELISAGNIGLLEAVRRFDPGRNIRFTTYAVWWIRQSIFYHLAETDFAFRIPPKIANILSRTRRFQSIPVAPDQAMEGEKLADELGVDLKDLTIALSAGASTISLSDPAYEDGEGHVSDTLEQSTIESPELHAIKKSLHRSLNASIRKLTDVEQYVLKMRFGLNGSEEYTLNEVGMKLHRSRERVRQIERDALVKLKRQYTRRDYAVL